MGSVYRRKGSVFLWLGFINGQGERQLVSSKTTNLEEAKQVLALLEREARAEEESGLAKKGPITTSAYAKQWIALRRLRGVDSAGDDEARLNHALPKLGRMALKDVRHRHVLDAIQGIRAKGELAPRSVRHVHSTLRVMFGDAVIAELIAANPCTLTVDRGELPPVEDKDPEWRQLAIFSREEVEQLISDERITERQRMLNGLLFLAGPRINEITPRHWRDYDALAKPLGMLRIHTSFSRTRKVVKAGTKTKGVTRQVPVHPTLARMLAAWKLGGWQRTYGRAPRPDDLLLPGSAGDRLDCVASLVDFHRDLDALGLRRRRQHDARRTFISLALADGARKELLKRVTHGAKGDVMDLYNTPPWDALCAEVARLNVQLLEGRVLALTGTATAKLQQPEGTDMTSESDCTRRDLKPSVNDSVDASEAPSIEIHGADANLEHSSSSQDGPDCSECSNPSGDYEERARALGFTLLFSTEAG